MKLSFASLACGLLTLLLLSAPPARLAGQEPSSETPGASPDAVLPDDADPGEPGSSGSDPAEDAVPGGVEPTDEDAAGQTDEAAEDAAGESASESAEETSSELSAQLESATRKVAGDEYLLQYKFDQGELIRTKVVHLASTDTTIRGNTQTSRARSISTKVWKILEVTEEGHTKFEHSVAKVEMWQHISGRPEVSYNSETDKKPPLEYELAAETVGKPLSVITVDRHGQVVEREDTKPSANIGLGQITTPLPPQKVKIGAQWHLNGEVAVRLPEGRVHRVKTRQQFTLQSVKTGVATISVKTQVLTPVNDPKVESQLMQQLTNGEIRFDIDAGRILSKQMDWDEMVIGFNGPESTLKYLARFTEEYLPQESTPRVAEKASP